MPWRRNSTASWPITIGFALQMPAGRRRTAYMNAPRSGSLVCGQRVQAGVHRRVRGLEHPQARLARGAQQRRVRAVVELDLVGAQPGGLAQRSAWLDGGDAQAGDGHEGGTLAHLARHAAWPRARKLRRGREGERPVPAAHRARFLHSTRRREIDCTESVGSRRFPHSRSRQWRVLDGNRHPRRSPHLPTQPPFLSPYRVSMPSPEEPLTGGCACGTVRFEVTAPFDTAGYCHCKRCQRRSGALWALNGSSASRRLPLHRRRGRRARLAAAERPAEVASAASAAATSSAARPAGRSSSSASAPSTATPASARSGTTGSPRRPTGSRCPTTACRASTSCRG